MPDFLTREQLQSTVLAGRHLRELQMEEWRKQIQAFVDTTSVDAVHRDILKRAEQGHMDAYLMFRPPYTLLSEMGVYTFFNLWQEPMLEFLTSIAEVRVTRFRYSRGRLWAHVEWLL